MKKLIITGFPRSGTSVLAKFLHDLGYATGGKWNNGINAGYEDEHVQKIVTTFNSFPLSEELIVLLEGEIKKVDQIVIKHPRFLMNPELIRIWNYIWPNTSILCTYREPLHAVESKKSVSNLGYSNNYSPAELDKKFNEFITILINLRINHHILYFPNFLQDYENVYHSISSLGVRIDRDKGRSIWYNLVDLDKVHFK